MTENNAPEGRSNKRLGQWIAIGVAVGDGLGVAFDNIAIGVAIGLCLGVAVGAMQSKRNG